MGNETDVVVETEQVNDGKVDMTREDAGTSEESSTEETAGQDASGKDVKTNSEDAVSEENSDDEEIEEALKSGSPIPYERFKKLNEGKKALASEITTLKAENEEMSGLLNNPSVFRAVLQAKGITDPNILAQKMKEAGFESEEKSDKSEDELFAEFSKGLDLATQKGWFEMMRRMSKHFSEETVRPIKGELTSKEIQSYIAKQEQEASELAKDVYGLEYGTAGKDEGNPNTAIGKMAVYLSKHHEDAKLGHVKILRLALSEEGLKLGEQKGKQKEKDRQKILKASAFEDDAQVAREGTPNAEWSVSEIMAWRKKNVK